MPVQQLSLEKARWGLAVIWFGASGAIFLILVIQSLLGTYGDNAQAAWNWALPNFLPTLALMISVFSADALRPNPETETTTVKKNFYRLSQVLSVFYQVCLFATILIYPFVATSTPDVDRLSLMQMSNLWLAPLQGLVIAAIGVLFFLKDE